MNKFLASNGLHWHAKQLHQICSFLVNFHITAHFFNVIKKSSFLFFRKKKYVLKIKNKNWPERPQ